MFGGILDHPLRQIRVECLPRSIPEIGEVDVSSLGIGDSIHVSQLRLPEGVEVKTDPTVSVASVVPPAAKEEASPARPWSRGGRRGRRGEGPSRPRRAPAKGRPGGKGKARA